MFEGSIIRVLRRLAELLLQLQTAATAIGNDDLVDKFTQAHKAVHRGLPFADSLYTT